MSKLSDYQNDALKLADSAISDAIEFAKGELEVNGYDLANRLGQALEVVRAAQEPYSGPKVRRLIRRFWTK